MPAIGTWSLPSLCLVCRVHATAATDGQPVPMPIHAAQQISFNHLVRSGSIDLLNLHNCLDAMNTIHPMRFRMGNNVGLVCAIELINDRSAFSLGSIAIERANEGTLAPSAEVAYVGPRECSNITMPPESGCEWAWC